MDAYRASTLSTAGIITDFPSLTVKTFPAYNFVASFMSNLLLAQQAMSSSVTALDGDNTGEEHPHLVPETERGF